MELKVTKEKVLEAASKCSVAKEALETLFPEAFKKVTPPINLYLLEPEINEEGTVNKRLFTKASVNKAGLENSSGQSAIQIYVDNSSQFWLSFNFNWELRTNGALDGHLLIPTRK